MYVYIYRGAVTTGAERAAAPPPPTLTMRGHTGQKVPFGTYTKVSLTE